MARVGVGERFALLDSNVVVYAMTKDYPDASVHEKCRVLLQSGLRGELGHTLSLNPIVVVESFWALRALLDWREAEFRVGSLLESSRLAFLTITREASRKAVLWAKQEKVPVNDAMIAANMVDMAELIYTADEEHFDKLEKHGVRFLNPTKL